MTRLPKVAILLVLALPAVATACMWDSDTIRMERVRFPSALELITGKFLRHSPEFYEWRAADRTRRLAADPSNLALLDDLAVAHDKTGRHDEAIATALRAEKLQPGRYETAANLGTFLIHAGHAAEGVPHIERAIAINPDAHFGREKYQKRLAEWVMARRKGDAAKLPLSRASEYCGEVARGSFAEFLWPESQTRNRLPPEELAAAVKGVLGMMRFGNYDSPILLEALGSLLTPSGVSDPHGDAKFLATRAYLKASYAVPEGLSRDAYRDLAANAIVMQTPNRNFAGQVTLEQVEADFRNELTEADKWYADLRQQELAWIAGGQDPEAEFERLYALEPEVGGMEVSDPMSPETRFKLLLAGAGTTCGLSMVAVVAAGLWLVRRWRGRRLR